MGLLYAVETHTINYHLKKVFDDAELEASSVLRNIRITAANGKTYEPQHDNLSVIIAVASMSLPRLRSGSLPQCRTGSTGPSTVSQRRAGIRLAAESAHHCGGTEAPETKDLRPET